MLKNGWVKLHRNLLDNAIWTTSSSEQKVILITILCLANHEEKQWQWKGQKFVCKPGQFITSSTNLANKSGCSRQNVRTALSKFKKYDFLTYESTKTGILVTIVNWDKYQCYQETVNQDANQDLTKSQPTPNQDLTTNKNDKKDKNIKNIYLHWNSKNIVVHKKLSDSIQKEIEKALSKYDSEEIMIAIDHYTIMLKNEDYKLCSYAWGLDNFLKRSNGYVMFMDNGEKWLNYQKWQRDSIYKTKPKSTVPI